MQSLLRIGLFSFLNLLIPDQVKAQFAPAAGKPGSTAIKSDSSCFVSWAKKCSVKRGLRQINLPDSGYATAGLAENAIGKALTKGIVSLGDGGSAVLTFNPPIRNGQGFDFAVFENAFNDSFLELAFVEVSSDSINWARFPAISLSPTQRQTNSFGATNPILIHNLAGKYRSPYGTPFDINDVIHHSFINPEYIPFVRIIDVVGSIDSAVGSKDSAGRIINDPFPTNFGSSGFDLDAIGVINQLTSMNVKTVNSTTPKSWVFYKPGYLTVHASTSTPSGNAPKFIRVFDVSGKLMIEETWDKSQGSTCQFSMHFAPGFYFIHIYTCTGSREYSDLNAEENPETNSEVSAEVADSTEATSEPGRLGNHGIYTTRNTPMVIRFSVF